MKFHELYPKIHGKTDIDVVKDGHIKFRVKYDFKSDRIPPELYSADVDYIQAVDYRTIEVGVE